MNYCRVGGIWNDQRVKSENRILRIQIVTKGVASIINVMGIWLAFVLPWHDSGKPVLGNDRSSWPQFHWQWLSTNPILVSPLELKKNSNQFRKDWFIDNLPTWVSCLEFSTVKSVRTFFYKKTMMLNRGINIMWECLFDSNTSQHCFLDCVLSVRNIWDWIPDSGKEL